MRLRIVHHTGLAVLVTAMALAGTGAPAQAQGAQHQNDQNKAQKKQKREERQQAQQKQKKDKQEQRQQQVERKKQQQREWSERYSVQLRDGERRAQQRADLLQTQRRNSQYQYQQRYIHRLRQQQREMDNWRSYDYDRDPYYYSVPTYRYSYGGRWYDTNQYGVDYLRQAVNYGYEEGLYAGRADREDRWNRGSYRDSYAYQDANYGYNGRYIDQSQYNYYFRQGFQRGYEDGRNSRSRYGRSQDGRFSLTAQALSQVLNFRSIQ